MGVTAMEAAVEDTKAEGTELVVLMAAGEGVTIKVGEELLL